MKVMILGSDGYIGYSLTQHLLALGHEVLGVDNRSRRRRVAGLGASSLTPIAAPHARRAFLRRHKGYASEVNITLGETSPSAIVTLLDIFKPDAIVHLAEMPSAPWSMASIENARVTQRENVIGTLDLLWAIREACPNAHLVKLGTMGEYGTPNCYIPEGRIPHSCITGYVDEKNKSLPCSMSSLLFPRTAGSFYHLSKVHDTFNIEFACRNWDLRSTDIMQGVVYGATITTLRDELELTRFDYDECFGTVINRFCAQALIGLPLTIYGEGGQTRGFLPLKESIRCLTLAIESPPTAGEYRTFNQFGTIHSINDLASLVQEASGYADLKYDVTISHIQNPRKEAESHCYYTTNDNLKSIGYVPTTNPLDEIVQLFNDLKPYKERIQKDVISPTIKWQ